MAAPERIRRVACVGAGVIGGGWVAHFLARGYQVIAWDPAEGFEDKLRRLVDAAWPALTELGLAEGASTDNLVIAASLQEAVADAEVVFLCVPTPMGSGGAADLAAVLHAKEGA